jgi:hypothetical protein
MQAKNYDKCLKYALIIVACQHQLKYINIQCDGKLKIYNPIDIVEVLKLYKISFH